MAGLMKMADAADWLGVSTDTLRDWVTARRVPFTTLASTDETGRPSTRTVRFAQHHLDAIVAMGEHAPEVAA